MINGTMVKGDVLKKRGKFGIGATGFEAVARKIEEWTSGAGSQADSKREKSDLGVKGGRCAPI